jgi:lipopolysaccharide biosynthesis glycosyltransferase
MTNKEPIIIAMVSDNNYAQHTAVTIASIIKNKSKNDFIRIHVISDGIYERNKTRISSLVQNNKQIELIFNNFNYELPKNICSRGRFPKNVYYRLYFGKIFSEYKKILYLDSDVIVLTSLSGLYGLNLDKNEYIAGVIAREFEYANQRLGLPLKNKYINSGVVLFNLDYWRKNKLFEKYIKYVKNNNPYFPNQDTTNFICYKKIKTVSPKWNAQIFSETRKLPETYSGLFKAINNPYIIHFLTREKPWHPYTKSYPDKHYYFDYLKLTPWSLYKFKYLFARYVFYFKWSKNIKILRIFFINIIREFRGVYYVFGAQIIGKYDKVWKESAKKK